MKKRPSKLFRNYRFNDGSFYRAEAGKDGVTEQDMRNLKNVIQSQYKTKIKVNRLETVFIDGYFIDDDKNMDFHDPEASVDLIIEASEKTRMIHRAINELLPQQQELIREIHFNDVSTAEFARKCGVTEGAIRDRLRKAYKQLEKKLKNF